MANGIQYEFEPEFGALNLTVFFWKLFLKCDFKILDGNYYKMPPLYEGDNYDECFQTYREDTMFCMVYSILKQPDTPSDLYAYIMVI